MSDEIEIFASGLTQDISLFVEPILEDVRLDVIISETREDVQLNVQPNLIEINLIRTVASAFADITGLPSDNAALNAVLNAKADLVDGKVPSAQLPSYVDDVIEVANFAALPATGESGKIYITINNNKIYRWSGSIYVEIIDSTAVWGAITGTLSSQTDLQNALNGKFNNPIGDTTQYIAGDGSLITFPVSGQAGTLVREVRNTTGATLTKGTVVYISGATGNKPTISKALATGDSTSAQTFGLLQANIANNANGYVVCVGDLTGLNTSAFSEGEQLYLSSTTAGTYTTTKQLAPAHLVYIGVVTRSHPTMGQIEVKIQNGYELDEIHDVAISSKVNNQFLVYESASDLWKNKSLATILGGTSSQFVKGNGTLDSNTYYLASNPNGYTTNVGTVTSVGLSTTTPGVLVNFSPITTSGTITLDILASSSEDTGLLRSTDWNTFNGKQGAITLTTTGTSGAATFIGNTLNIPQYAPNLSGYVPTSRTLTINGTALDLSANRSWSVGTVTSVGLTSATSGVTIGSSPITTSGNITLAIATASGSQQGLLSATDWTTFNNKQNALTNPITGTGTTNYLPKFTGASTLGNSLIYDNGTNVGIGTTSPIGNAGSTAMQLVGADYPVFTVTSSNQSINGRLGVGFGNVYLGTATNHPFNIITNDNVKLTVTTSGNVGIGTTTPNFSATGRTVLDINGTSNTMLCLSVGGTAGSYFYQSSGNLNISNEVSGAIISYTGGSERMRITSAGNVGIGTSSPVAKLHTYLADGANDNILRVQNGSNAYASVFNLVANNDGGAVYNYISSSTNAGTEHWRIGGGATTSTMAISTAGTERLRITSAGNVGIGTTSPSEKLQIGNGTGTNSQYLRLFSAQADIYIGQSGGAIFGQPANQSGLIVSDNGTWPLAIGTSTAQPLIFGTSNAERMRITSGGDLLVGTTSALLSASGRGVVEINGTSSSVIGLKVGNSLGSYLYSNNTDTELYSANALKFAVSGAERMRITSAGNVGIGTSSPSEKLHVNGNIKTGTLSSGTTAHPFKIGQISSGVPTLINKLEIEIDGVTYYIPASIGTV
jgi:hypothetical protein